MGRVCGLWLGVSACLGPLAEPPDTCGESVESATETWDAVALDVVVERHLATPFTVEWNLESPLPTSYQVEWDGVLDDGDPDRLRAVWRSDTIGCVDQVEALVLAREGFEIRAEGFAGPSRVQAVWTGRDVTQIASSDDPSRLAVADLPRGVPLVDEWADLLIGVGSDVESYGLIVDDAMGVAQWWVQFSDRVGREDTLLNEGVLMR